MMFVCVVDVLKHSFVAMLEPFFQSLRKEGKGEGGGGEDSLSDGDHICSFGNHHHGSRFFSSQLTRGAFFCMNSAIAELTRQVC